nr:ribonuclease H-like domain-containing protein [Tanacetum cinerariifolium]
MFDCGEMFSSETDESLPASPKYDRNRKACFVCKSLTHLIKDCDYYEKKMAQTPARNHAQRRNHQQYAKITLPNPQRHVVPTSVLTKSMLVLLTAARPVTTIVPQTHVTRPRQVKPVVTKHHSLPRRNINRNQFSKPRNFPLKFTTVKAPMFCGMKGIKREFSVPRTPQQNEIAKRKNRTLIEAARTMLADSLLPIPFWAEAVNIACYVQNRVLVTKPQNKTLYELLLGRTPSIGFMRPFGCLVTILNTPDPLDKFNGKADEGFLVGYSVSSKAFRVFNSRTRIIQETLHINFLEKKPNVAGSGPTWLFDIDTLTKTMNYQPVTAGNQCNPSAGVQEQFDAEKAGEENVQQYVLFPLWFFGSTNPQNTDDDAAFGGKKPEFEREKPESEVHVSPSSNFSNNNINEDNAADSPVHAVGQISTNNTNTFSATGASNTVVSPTHRKSSYMDPSQYPDDPNMPALEDITYSDNEEDVGAEADFTNLETNITVSPIPTTRVHKDHHEEGNDYEKVFAPVARIEAIRLFLAYASFMGFMVYQMDVKSAFLYETIEEEVYVCQPLGFEDPDYPDKRGKIDQTLFIKNQKGDILLVHVYVDDIIFGSTNKDLCKPFEKLMKDKFKMSSMGELTFFLDRKSASTPIDTEKPLLKDPDDRKSASTPIDTEKPLLKDPDGEDVDVHM